MQFEKDVEHCLEVLKTGGTILYPTDTIWGIGCDATNASAVEKIIELKQRPAQKSFVVLVAGCLMSNQGWRSRHHICIVSVSMHCL